MDRMVKIQFDEDGNMVRSKKHKKLIKMEFNNNKKEVESQYQDYWEENDGEHNQYACVYWLGDKGERCEYREIEYDLFGDVKGVCCNGDNTDCWDYIIIS